MWEVIARIPEHDLTGFLICSLAIISVTTVFMTTILVRCWSRSNERQLAAPLVEQMLARGMEPAEIEDLFHTAWCTKPRGLSGLLKKTFGSRRSPVLRDAL